VGSSPISGVPFLMLFFRLKKVSGQSFSKQGKAEMKYRIIIGVDDLFDFEFPFDLLDNDSKTFTNFFSPNANVSLKNFVQKLSSTEKITSKREHRIWGSNPRPLA
jgi:hypothetical protein